MFNIIGEWERPNLGFACPYSNGYEWPKKIRANEGSEASWPKVGRHTNMHLVPTI